jgi:hypothetical protein
MMNQREFLQLDLIWFDEMVETQTSGSPERLKSTVYIALLQLQTESEPLC